MSRVSSENRLGRMVCYIPLKFWWGPPVLTRKDKRSADLIKGVQTVYLIRLLESVKAKRLQCLSIILLCRWSGHRRKCKIFQIFQLLFLSSFSDQHCVYIVNNQLDFYFVCNIL